MRKSINPAQTGQALRAMSQDGISAHILINHKNANNYGMTYLVFCHFFLSPGIYLTFLFGTNRLRQFIGFISHEYL